jgi:hypothetical protein
MWTTKLHVVETSEIARKTMRSEAQVVASLFAVASGGGFLGNVGEAARGNGTNDEQLGLTSGSAKAARRVYLPKMNTAPSTGG